MKIIMKKKIKAAINYKDSELFIKDEVYESSNKISEDVLAGLVKSGYAKEVKIKVAKVKADKPVQEDKSIDPVVEDKSDAPIKEDKSSENEPKKKSKKKTTNK